MAPKEASKKAEKKPVKAEKKVVKEGGKKKKIKKSTETYKMYIYKVLKQVHPDTGISSKAMSIMNSFVNDIFEKLAAESSRLARYNKKPTITSREIQTAVRLILPGELAKHAVSEGTKATEKEEEERRLNEKREREALNKKLHDAMNARLDEMYEVVHGQKRSGNDGAPTMEKLLKEIEKLQLAQSTVVRNDGASTSRPPIRDDALLAKMMQEHEDMKGKLETAAVVNKRVELLEESVKAVKQQHEHALQEAEIWKKEALRYGNKRSWLATSLSSQLKMPLTTPRKSTLERPFVDPNQLAQLHTLEVNALKEMRLQELNRRCEAEQENARLKEKLAKRDAEREAPKSVFQQRLDAAGGSVAKSGRG
ncbi:hypothetical protein CBR_g52319 [Chara braunii]|uniref:Histone H2B n=1 Tax=Chara braunii TaxID=69332 RepID=A0A388K6P0_CHABU|nr:hypothetical protein CBR_g52319 [Chara braunii]|eukprot:GBG65725.1 hypothetical protein CBR_g52319 [Chara braunii]